MNEVWKDIEGYEGLYQVYNLGRVKSLERLGADGRKLKERILKFGVNENNYYYVNLRKDGKTIPKYLHRLIMENFCPCENMNDLQVDHIDFNPQNNSLENLRWLTPKENYKKKKVCKRVCCIETNIIYESVSEAARVINRKSPALSSCLNGKSKTCGGYHWEYID